MTKEREPAWLIAKVDQRLAFMKDKLGSAGMAFVKTQVGILMTPLTEPEEDATPAEQQLWENACDNCGAHVPGALWTGSVERELDGIQVVITFGACARCAGKERS